MILSNIECNICFELKSEEFFFSLKCCNSNKICKTCVSHLLKSECPFCRVPNENIYGRKRSMSNQFDYSTNTNENPVSFMDIHVTSFDDMTYYSKIYRRKRKQLLKLREREDNYMKNYINNIMKVKSKNRKNIQIQDIKKNIRFDLKDYKTGS